MARSAWGESWPGGCGGLGSSVVLREEMDRDLDIKANGIKAKVPTAVESCGAAYSGGQVPLLRR